MVSGVNLQTLKGSGKIPCSVCRKGVGSNSIYCAGCSHWVHKKCSGVIGSLKSNPDYRFMDLWLACLISTAAIGVRISVVAVKFHNVYDYTIERHPWQVSENQKPRVHPSHVRERVVRWVPDETQD